MDLLRIAARVAEQTTAGPTLDIFKDLSGGNVDEILVDEAVQHDDTEAVDVMVSAIHDVYGPELAEEVSKASNVGGATSVVHELLHKVAEPEFLLTDPSGEALGTYDQTKKSLVESTVDELLIQWLEREKVLDFDNIFTGISESFDTVDQVLGELEKGAQHPVLDRVLKGAASHVRRERPELPGKGRLDKSVYAGREHSAVDVVLWTVQDYIESKLPRLAETMISAPAEAKFKKFVNLALSRLRKLPRTEPNSAPTIGR